MTKKTVVKPSPDDSAELLHHHAVRLFDKTAEHFRKYPFRSGLAIHTQACECLLRTPAVDFSPALYLGAAAQLNQTADWFNATLRSAALPSFSFTLPKATPFGRNAPIRQLTAADA